MKRNLMKIVVTTSALVLFLCGCSQNSNNSSREAVSNVQQVESNSETNTNIVTKAPTDDSMAKAQDHEIRDASSFLDVKWFITMDPKYDESKYRFAIYVQKVQVSDSDETEVVVGSVTRSLKSGNVLDATIIAEKAFIDSERPDGPICQEKQSWWQNGKEYTGTSVINVSLEELENQYHISEEDMVLNERYTLYSDLEG